MIVPFPLSEIYHLVLVEGWSIREIQKEENFVRVTVYIPCKGIDDYLKNRPWCRLVDVLDQTRHFEFSLYTNEEE